MIAVDGSAAMLSKALKKVLPRSVILLSYLFVAFSKRRRDRTSNTIIARNIADNRLDCGGSPNSQGTISFRTTHAITGDGLALGAETVEIFPLWATG